MKRIVIIAMFVVFAQITAGFSKPVPQTFPGATKLSLRRIDVNAKTITALSAGKDYIVDLTQRGVVYEFSHKTGQMDLSRVKVRTPNGELTLGSYLETTVLKGKLAGFKYKSQDFSLVNTQTGTVQKAPTAIKGFQCETSLCTCTGSGDCIDLFLTGLCKIGTGFCIKNPVTGQEQCACGRQ